ncbi:MAG: hypothetical protein ACN4GR_17330 [Arenicellales bacterium]
MKTPNEMPDASEFGQLRSYLARNGFKQAWIRAAIGNNPSGRTRAEITGVLIAELKVLPKA